MTSKIDVKPTPAKYVFLKFLDVLRSNYGYKEFNYVLFKGYGVDLLNSDYGIRNKLEVKTNNNSFFKTYCNIFWIFKFDFMFIEII